MKSIIDWMEYFKFWEIIMFYCIFLLSLISNITLWVGNHIILFHFQEIITLYCIFPLSLISNIKLHKWKSHVFFPFQERYFSGGGGGGGHQCTWTTASWSITSGGWHVLKVHPYCSRLPQKPSFGGNVSNFPCQQQTIDRWLLPALYCTYHIMGVWTIHQHKWPNLNTFYIVFLRKI